VVASAQGRKLDNLLDAAPLGRVSRAEVEEIAGSTNIANMVEAARSIARAQPNRCTVVSTSEFTLDQGWKVPPDCPPRVAAVARSVAGSTGASHAFIGADLGRAHDPEDVQGTKRTAALVDTYIRTLRYRFGGPVERVPCISKVSSALRASTAVTTAVAESSSRPATIARSA
jgi:hypothetical protein